MEAIVYINCYLVLGVRRAAFDCDVFIILFMCRCIALTAELTNGTFVGMRGCLPATAGNCSGTSACNQRNGTLSGQAYFARCVAECCTEEKCNSHHFPMLPEPSSSPAPTSPTPAALDIKMKAFLYLHVFLLVILVIMN